MATILNAYSLAGGDTVTSTISDANNVRLQVIVTGTTATAPRHYVWGVAEISEDGGTTWSEVRDEKYKIAKFIIHGDGDISPSFNGFNATSLRFRIEPDATHDGTITIISKEA